MEVRDGEGLQVNMGKTKIVVSGTNLGLLEKSTGTGRNEGLDGGSGIPSSFKI